MSGSIASVAAAAKINMSLVVGGRRADGLHELATVMQRIDLCDDVELEHADGLVVEGFEGDTLVRSALEELASAAGVEPTWRVKLRKRIPLAAGLGGGSADAAASLGLANRTLARPLGQERLREVAARVGSDVPFFLEPGPKLVTGAGEQLERIELPQDFWVVVVLGRGATKRSTASVYARFDELEGEAGFSERRQRLVDALRDCRRPRDLAALPLNDLTQAAGDGGLLRELRAAGAFRADLSGAGPAVYALFQRRRDARTAAARLGGRVRAWVVAPVW